MVSSSGIEIDFARAGASPADDNIRDPMVRQHWRTMRHDFVFHEARSFCCGVEEVFEFFGVIPNCTFRHSWSGSVVCLFC